MATALAPQATTTRAGEHRFLLTGVGWEGYEALLKMIGDRPIRITYDGKNVELMSPSQHHEFYKKVIGWMLETIFEELNVPYEPAGSTTWRTLAHAKGLEADECYYLNNLERVRQRRNHLDLAVDPPPDLAVEIEISPSDLDRLEIYAALGISEVWRFDGEALRIVRLQPDNSYVDAPSSTHIPTLTPAEVAAWVEDAAATVDRPAWNRVFRAWVRAELAPRR